MTASPTSSSSPLPPTTTSSTPRSARLRRPLQSPPPSSPTSPSVDRTDHHPNHHRHHDDDDDDDDDDVPLSTYRITTSHGLEERHLREILAVFRIFDEDRSGILDLDSFEVMMRSLGFRTEREEMEGLVERDWEERRGRRVQGGENEEWHGQDVERGDEEMRRVDLQTAVGILARKGYGERDFEKEIQMYFRIFDGGNKGYIDLRDLKRVQKEILEESAAGQWGFDVAELRDSTLEAMIREFDGNWDGVLDLEEFAAVLRPILSRPSS
mmetsp:Transcript_21416/g.45020  ORF Transcript_21416/g.45020 Transcript_21416/m.45020 type:complete len:268 (-) Transcript_21416:265-1068(-)